MGLAIQYQSLQAALHAIKLRSERKLSFDAAISIAAERYGKTTKEISRLVGKGRNYLTGLLSSQETVKETAEVAEKPADSPFTEDEKKLADPWAKLEY